MMPFHQWKDKQVEEDSKKHGVLRYYRMREWYWKAYGNYCNQCRKQLTTQH